MPGSPRLPITRPSSPDTTRPAPAPAPRAPAATDEGPRAGLRMGGPPRGLAAATPARPSVGRAAPGPARPEGLPPPGDLELAGYLLAREATGRPIDPATRDLLKEAHATRQDVLAMMPFGRANSRADLAQTRDEGYQRLLAFRHAVRSVSSLGEAPSVTQARDAALVARVGSGNCGEFANVAAHVHAGRLRAGERITQEKSGSVDHSWVVVRGRAGPGQSPARALIDVWGEGPVVEPEDSHFVGSAPGSPLTVHAIDSEDARAASDRFEATRADPGPGLARRLDTLVEANRRQGKRPADGLYDAVPIVSRRLRRAAAAAIEPRRADPALRERAAALAREISPFPDALREQVADEVMTAATRLDASWRPALPGAPEASPDAPGDATRHDVAGP